MTEQTLTTKQVQELRAGDAVVIPERDQDVFEVRDVHIWRAPITAFRLDAAVFVVSLSTGAADTLTGRADQVLALATDEQRAAAVEEHVRRRVVAELQELAAFIERTKPRIVDYFEAPRVSIRLEGGEIERVAEAIGVGTTEYGSGARRAVWPGPDRVGVVSAEFVGAPAPVAPAVPAHHHVGGSSGGPGECSAECACGVTYAGFDTLAEAVAVLDQHIANSDSAGEPTPAEPGSNADLPADNDPEVQAEIARLMAAGFRRPEEMARNNVRDRRAKLGSDADQVVTAAPGETPTTAQALCIRRAAGQIPGEDVFASRPDVMERCELAGWIDREPGEGGRWYATESGLAALATAQAGE